MQGSGNYVHEKAAVLQDKVLIHSRASRLFHWSFALSAILLILTGFYNHRPFYLGPVVYRGITHTLHISGYLSMGIFTAWIYYMIVTGDYRHLLLRLRDLREFPVLIKYNLFLEQKLPPHAKYNVGQKLIYTGWFFAFVIEAVTGLFMEFPGWIKHIPPLTMQQIRYYHFVVGLYFVVTVPLHVYLAVTEDPARFQAIFTGWVKKPQKDPFEVR